MSRDNQRFLTDYIDLIDGLSARYHSLRWWSYPLASKDYHSSPFFEDLYHFDRSVPARGAHSNYFLNWLRLIKLSLLFLARE